MAYGILKCDTVTFTNAGVDKSVTLSGLVQNPTFSGNVTVTGTVSGTTATFTTGTFTSLTGTTSQGTTATYTSGSFTSLTGVTTSGTTANFVSGVFTTQISGATITGTAGAFATLTGGVATLTSGVFALGTEALPSITFTGNTDTGIYSPGANQVAITTSGTGRLFVDASGTVNIKGAGSAGVTQAVSFDGSAPVDSLVLTSGGNVGIKTANPNVPLTVQADSNAYAHDLIGRTADNTSIIRFKTSDNATALGSIGQYGTTMNINSIGAGPIVFYTNNQEHLRITAAGDVGIGTVNPSTTLDVNGSSNVTATSLAQYFGINAIGTGNGVGNGIFAPASNTLGFSTGANECARLTASGQLLVGTSMSITGVAFPSQIQSNAFYAYSASLFSADNIGSHTWFLKSRNATVNQHTAVQSGDVLGRINFAGSDGDEFIHAALIQAVVDNGAVGTAVSNDECPAALVFSTTADGASSPTERMRIDNAGRVGIGKTPASSIIGSGIEFGSSGLGIFTRSSDTPLLIHRTTNDGDLIAFYQDTNLEGSISVSGTTVSCNGAHLSRWSQLPGGIERTEILRGTILSNIDEMCEWPDEDNEQLNRMKVSDVEGDKNVSGVFQAWDDDDDTYTNDFYCAMTGDFIIRIGAGVTVERGDLLMSAGDGTAKPQDDDIIRSKTIAKVTSTNVTCTYDDGSYCVPCVLMAC